MAALVVHLNRGELYDVEPAAPSFETAGPFTVELRNYGQPVHVHLRFDEGLSRVASLDGTNLYVEGESLVRVPVEVPEGTPAVEGALSVVTGYGKGTAEVGVSVVEEPAEQRSRPVDDALGESRTGEDAADGDPLAPLASLRGRLPDGVSLPDSVGDAPAVVGAVALAVLALGAVGVAASLGSSLGVVAAIFVGLLAVGVTGYAMVR